MIKQMMATIPLWLAMAGMHALYAQQKEATLGSLWPKVVENYPGVEAKTTAIDAARLHERIIKSNGLPQIKAQAQNTYGTYEGSAGAFFPQAGFFNVSGSSVALNGSSTTANSFGSATAEWELFSFGKLRKENEAASAWSNKMVSERDAYLLDLKKTLSERYITLLYNDAKLNWTAKNAERLDSIRDITAGLSAAGLRPAADSLLAASSYLQARGEYDKWKGLKSASFIKLLELYGGDTVDYAASANRFSNPIESGMYEQNTISPLHPILHALDKQTEYYIRSGEAQKRAVWPSMRLLGGYAYRGTGINPNGSVSGAWKDGFHHGSRNFLIGLGLTWNMTGLHTNRLKGEVFLKEAANTQLLHKQYEQAMQADLSASQTKISQQYRQLTKTKLAVKQSQAAYQMYLARYKSGLMALSELLQIRTLLEQAEDTHMEASLAYWMLLAYEAELTADFDFLFTNL